MKGNTAELLSLNAFDLKHSIFEIVPSFRFDSTSSDKTSDSHAQDLILEVIVAKLSVHLKRLEDKLIQPFQSIEASNSTLVNDLHNVNAHVRELMDYAQQQHQFKGSHILLLFKPHLVICQLTLGL